MPDFVPRRLYGERVEESLLSFLSPRLLPPSRGDSSSRLATVAGKAPFIRRRYILRILLTPYLAPTGGGVVVKSGFTFNQLNSLANKGGEGGSNNSSGGSEGEKEKKTF